jgi:hypothetical protein
VEMKHELEQDVVEGLKGVEACKLKFWEKFVLNMWKRKSGSLKNETRFGLEKELSWLLLKLAF